MTMIRLQGKFKPKQKAEISIHEGPDKGWKGDAEILENQKGVQIARALEGHFPSGQDYYTEVSFKILGIKL